MKRLVVIQGYLLYPSNFLNFQSLSYKPTDFLKRVYFDSQCQTEAVVHHTAARNDHKVLL